VNMYMVEFNEIELGALASHLISSLRLLRKNVAQIYANNLVSKNGDVVIGLTIEQFENALQKLLIHLPDDFRERAEKRQRKLDSMDIREAIEETGKTIKGQMDLDEWLYGPDWDENQDKG